VSSALETVVAAREALLAAGTARCRTTIGHHWPIDLPRPRHPLARGALWVAGRALRNGIPGQGILDLPRRRYMLDFGSYAQLEKDGLAYSGLSGSALREGRPDRGPFTPLWMIDVLAGLVDATEVADPSPAFRRIDAVVDLGRAADATPAFALPQVPARLDWRAFPVGVRLAGSRIARVEHLGGVDHHALELFDYGVSLEGVDWSRLPDLSGRPG